MRIEEFSDTYQVCALTSAKVDTILTLCSGNALYYEYCPPFVSKDGILEDMKALPPGKTMEDKYYIGFFKNEKLIAVMDFIDHHPERNIAFIGFFMTDASVQHEGVGTAIIKYLCHYLASEGYQSIRLAWVKGNPQAEHFWIKNQFKPIKECSSSVAEKVILAERELTFI